MFTGIVDHKGVITGVSAHAEALSLAIQSTFESWSLGESIAVDGMCLTVTAFDQGVFHCDLSPETLAVTTAKGFAPGQAVNLERALQLSDRLGGHVVTGHVDSRAELVELAWQGEFLKMRFKPQDAQLMRFVCHKGSVTLNGVSLTVNAVTLHDFDVLLIPHTLQRTNLTALSLGDCVNLEVDYLARYVARHLQFPA